MFVQHVRSDFLIRSAASHGVQQTRGLPRITVSSYGLFSARRHGQLPRCPVGHAHHDHRVPLGALLRPAHLSTPDVTDWILYIRALE